MADAIEAMEIAFGNDRENPHRQLLGSSFFMPARVGRISGIKVVSIVPGKPVGIVTVFDGDGAPIGSVDGPTLTAIRTGAAAGLATRILSDESSHRFALLGAGAMGFDQVRAIKSVRKIDSITIWNRDRARAEALAERVHGSVANTPDEAVRGADIVTTVTPSMTPLFTAEALTRTAHINAIGAFTPDMVEVPAAVVRNAYRVVDDRHAASLEAGDLLQAEVDADAEIGDLLTGFRRGDGVTLFKSVGIASQDVAAAATALENAERLGVGTVV
jgi:ornithine cyclodeaminase